jgi:Domain of unknown function (DUF397)
MRSQRIKPVTLRDRRFSSNTVDKVTGRHMSNFRNGMPATELSDVTWQKSKHSNPNGACVEVAYLPGGEIAMRNSRFPAGPALVYTRDEIAAFLAGAKDGEFDHVI